MFEQKDKITCIIRKAQENEASLDHFIKQIKKMTEQVEELEKLTEIDEIHVKFETMLKEQPLWTRGGKSLKVLIYWAPLAWIIYYK